MAEPTGHVEIGIVLLIDPDSSLRAAHASALRAEGLYVEEHTEAVAALTRAPVVRPDLVITELHLAGMDGAGLCRALKLDPNARYAAVIALTCDPEGASMQAKTVFDRVLAKPVAIDRLVSEAKYLVALSSYLRLRADQISASADVPEASLAVRARRAALDDSIRFCPRCRSRSVEQLVMPPEPQWWHCLDCGEYWRPGES